MSKKSRRKKPQQAAKAEAPEERQRSINKGRIVKRTLLGLLAVFVLVFLALEVVIPLAAKSSLLAAGTKAPAITLTDSGGTAHTLPDEANSKAVILNFFDVDCGPCQREVAGLCTAAAAHPGVLVVGIESAQHSAAALEDFRRTQGNGCLTTTTIVLLPDPTRSATAAYNVFDTPTAYLVKDGKVVDSGLGEEGLTKLFAAT